MANFGNSDDTTQTPPGAPEASTGRSRRRRGRIVVASAVLVALVTAGIVAALTSSGTTAGVLSGRTGTKAHAFSLVVVSQPKDTVNSAQLGGEDLVLNFWASWCFPCQQEMPALQAAALRLRGKVRFVGVDTNDTRSIALGFLDRIHVTYLTLFDPNGQVASAYGLFGLPSTVFISHTGEVLGRHSGQLDSSSLQSALTEAFGSSVAS